MGFPYESATWDVVDGPMFMGWGSVMPGIFTAIAIALCVYVLWAGNRDEHKCYDKAK
jgi:hypothetical protein